MHTKWAIVLALVFGLMGLAGCYETPDVIVYEAGEYKGARDPLLDQPAAERDQILKQRFELVQLDR